MEYVKITISVPKGYEEQVLSLVKTKIEGILSTILLKPTADKISEFNTEVSISTDLNSSEKAITKGVEKA